MVTKNQMEESGVSVVLGSYNRKHFLKMTIQSLRRELSDVPFPYEIIVVDGGSSDGSLNWLIKQKDIITITQHNHGVWNGEKIPRRSWGYFMNLGFKSAQGKYICMVSDDCLIVPDAIKNGYTLFEERLNAGDKVGAVAFYWRNWPEQKSYWVGHTLGGKLVVNHGLYLNSALNEVEYIDEDNFHFYYADGDLCLKLWNNGYTVIESPNSFIEHYSHATLSTRKNNLEREKEDWSNYVSKWAGVFSDRMDEVTGGWINREYEDRSMTANAYSLYHQLHRIQIIRQIPGYIMRKIRERTDT
jgi:glycosyltransferase involved in cell wall biosynthesis